jgi:long-chain fatty acid transport protein
MKKIINKLLLAALLLPATAMAGGIVTNTNQSASFIRKPVQDAVIDVTGTYYNPAGLAFLQDGFHLSLSNQTIFQTRTINSTFPRLNRTEFEGSVSAPLFPTVYAVYKTGSMAFSFGVNPIGGGGSAVFEDGLPSFEQQVAVLPTLLSASGIPTTQYSMNAAFDGSSLNWGFQVNASYAINEMISVSAGLRYIVANNSYKGHLKDIMINPNMPAFGAIYNGTNMVSAPTFFTNASTTFAALNMGATNYSVALSQMVESNYGNTQLSDATALGLTPEQIQQIQGIIMAAGQNPAGLTIENARNILAASAPIFGANAATMTGYASMTGDKELEATQSGTGIAPVIGVNFRVSENLNFAVKYEHMAKITLKNSTTVDNVGMYPDGAEVRSDMPSMLAAGVSFKAIPALTLSGGVHYYFDKSADYGKSRPNSELFDNNFMEYGLGAEYAITRRFLLSAGYLRTQTGVNDLYHSDLSHSLSTNSIGGGLKYFITPDLALNLGFMNTMYLSHTKGFEYKNQAGQTVFPYDETYSRVARTFAIGVDFRF